MYNISDYEIRNDRTTFRQGVQIRGLKKSFSWQKHTILWEQSFGGTI